MNRWNSNSRKPRSALFLIALVGGFTLAPGLFPSKLAAQTVIQREFPLAALRGILLVTQPPEVFINRRPARLSPAARIHGVNNLLVMSGALVGQEITVNYLLNGQGDVQEVWILSDGEAELKRPNMRQGFNTLGDSNKPDLSNTPFDQLPRFGAQPAPAPAPTPNQ